MTNNHNHFFILFITLSLCTIISSSATNARKSSGQEELNDAFDTSLRTTIEMFDDKLSPYIVPDMVLNFSRRVAFVKWKGELKLANIQLSQLQSVVRTSDLAVQESLKPGILKTIGSLIPGLGSSSKNSYVCRVTTNLNFDRVFYTADFGISFLGMGIKRHLEGWTDDINVETTISYDTKMDVLSLDKLVIHSMKEPRLKVHGDGIFMDSVSNFLIQTGVKVFKHTHKFILEKVIKSLFGKRIPNSDLLKEVVGNVC